MQSIFRLGNEIWSYLDQMNDLGYKSKEDMTKWFVQCVKAYAEAMKAVDPDIEILMDGNLNMDNTSIDITDSVLKNPVVENDISYLAYSFYEPLDFNKLYKGAGEYDVSKVTAEEAWQATVATPYFDANGEAAIPGGFQTPYKSNGERWKGAFTEWNWNGHNETGPGMDISSSLLAHGVGAAGWLNAFMRSGDYVSMATQSALVCNSWDIGSIHTDLASGMSYYVPSGLVTTLYNKYHGENRLEMTEENVPSYTEPFSMAKPVSSGKVSAIDAVATESGSAVYFHAINRDYSKSYSIEIDLTGTGTLNDTAIQHTMTGRLNNIPLNGESPQPADITDSLTGKIENGKLVVTLPARSVSVIEFPKTNLSGASGWAVPEVQEAIKYGVATGNVLSNFQSNLTREEFCELAVKLFDTLGGVTTQNVTDNPFSDTVTPAVIKAYHLGITNGISPTLFGPSDPIPRQQMSTMIYRTLKAALPNTNFKPEKTETFSDASEINSWALESICFCYEKGIIKGSGGGINPNGFTTREQGIIMMKRAFVEYYYGAGTSSNADTSNGTPSGTNPGGTGVSDNINSIAQWVAYELLGKSKSQGYNPIEDPDVKALFPDGVLADTREACIYSFVKYKGYDCSGADLSVLSRFRDAGDISESCKKAVAYLTQKGIIKGNADGNFRPKEAMNSGSFAALFSMLKSL